MSNILFYGIWLAAGATILLALIGLLPPGTQYPFPQEIEASLFTIVGYAHSLDMILPLSTLFTILKLAIVLFATTRILFLVVGKMIAALFKLKPGNS